MYCTIKNMYENQNDEVTVHNNDNELNFNKMMNYFTNYWCSCILQAIDETHRGSIFRQQDKGHCIISLVDSHLDSFWEGK